MSKGIAPYWYLSPFIKDAVSLYDSRIAPQIKPICLNCFIFPFCSEKADFAIYRLYFPPFLHVNFKVKSASLSLYLIRGIFTYYTSTISLIPLFDHPFLVLRHSFSIKELFLAALYCEQTQRIPNKMATFPVKCHGEDVIKNVIMTKNLRLYWHAPHRIHHHPHLGHTHLYHDKHSYVHFPIR